MTPVKWFDKKIPTYLILGLTIWLLAAASESRAQDTVLRGGLYADGYQTVPILVYGQPAGPDGGDAGLTRSVFENQMAYLEDNGYRVVSLAEAVGFMEYKRSLPPAAVVLTFDVPNMVTLNTVVPVLQKHQFRATFFVSVALVGQSEHPSWPQFKTLLGQGMDIQNRGMVSSDMADYRSFKTPADYYHHVWFQMHDSHQQIREQLGVNCRFFAYPLGRSNSLMVAILQKLNYRAGLALEPGGNPFFQPRFHLKRYLIKPTDGLAVFKNKLMVFREQPLK